jgi:AcrR family transcriptional regulator
MQERSEITRNKILSSAAKQFAAEGYDRTAVADICEEAGISKGAFFHHYPTKQALFLAVLNAWLMDLDKQLAVVLQGSSNVAEGLVKMAELTSGVFDSADGQLGMFLEFWTQAIHDPQVWQATVAPYRRYAELFSGYLQAGIEDGSLRPMDTNMVSRVIVALALGMLLQGVMDPKGAQWDEMTKNGIQLLLTGLQRRSV